MGPGFSYYDVLGVRPTASPDAIKAAYRDAARRYHPDRLGAQDGASHLFALVGQAYEVLADPVKRAGYDPELSGPDHVVQPSQPPEDPQGFVYAQRPPAPTPAPARKSRGTGWLLLLMIAAGVTVYTMAMHGHLGYWLHNANAATLLGFVAAGAVPVVPLVALHLLRRLVHRFIR